MFSIEYDKAGNFRIVHLASGKTSEWTDYKFIAQFGYDGNTYIAAGGYYFGRGIPTERVCKVEIQETILSEVRHEVAPRDEDVDDGWDDISVQQQKEGG
jgi:hypothetical protein